MVITHPSCQNSGLQLYSIYSVSHRFASLMIFSQTIKHLYCYLPWLALCGGSKTLVVVRTSSHALCSSSHRCPGNHSTHPHMGLLCREKHRTTFVRTSSSSCWESDYHFSRRKESYKRALKLGPCKLWRSNTRHFFTMSTLLFPTREALHEVTQQDKNLSVPA